MSKKSTESKGTDTDQADSSSVPSVSRSMLLNRAINKRMARAAKVCLPHWAGFDAALV